MAQYWLMKSEPDAFALDDLAARPDGTEPWDGVRNYQARNMMRDQMQPGDQVFFYHSNCKVPGIVGIAEVVRSGYPDHTAFDPNAKYHDPKSDPDNPRWYMVDVTFEKKFPRQVPLAELRKTPGLEEMLLLKKGMRLSIQPVTKDQFDIVVSLGNHLTNPRTRANRRNP